jgi:hypothetical protein
MGKSSDNETICALVQMCQDLKEKLSTVKGKMNSPHLTEQDRVRLESLHRQLAEQQRIQLEHLFKVLLPYMRGWATSPQFTKFREVQDSRVHDEKNYISHDSSARKTSSPAPRTTSLQYNGEIEDDDFTKIAATLFRYILEALPRLPSLEPDRNPVGLLRKAVYRRMVDEVKRRNPQRSKKPRNITEMKSKRKPTKILIIPPKMIGLLTHFLKRHLISDCSTPMQIMKSIDVSIVSVRKLLFRKY